MTQQTMRIVRFRGFEKGFVLEEAKVPEVGQDAVLIRVKCCAVSGTDVYRYRRYEKPTIPPFSDGDTPGHEITGVVEEVGRDVKRFNVGDRVVVQPFWGCGACPDCEEGRENFCPRVQAFGFHVPGGFCEFIRAREDIVLKFEPPVSFEEAVATHHVAVNLGGLKSSGVKVGPGTSVAVFGTGNLGLLMVMILKSLSVSQVFAVDVDPRRLALASELSGSIPVDARSGDPGESIMRLTHGAGVDVSVELAGGNAPTLGPAIRATRKGGAFIALAVRGEHDALNFRQILSKSLRVQGSTTHTMKEMEESLAMIREGHVKTGSIITHRFPLSEINQAFECRLDDPKALYVVVDV